MSRLNIIEDTAAQVCFRYIHGGYDQASNIKIWEAVHNVVEHNAAITFIYEIAYRIGYAHSYLADAMSEVTYKKRKKTIRDKLAKIDGERREQNER